MTFFGQSSNCGSWQNTSSKPRPQEVFKAFDFMDHNKLWKIMRQEYQTTRPASWETCMQVRKQQLELDMEQQTGSK